MCFSATADVVGGLAITGIGAVTLNRVHRRGPDHLALAALPLLFGLHQLTEVFVWWALQGHIPPFIGTIATWVYLLFAFVVLPTYVPLAIRALEPPGTRRRVMTGFVALGAVVSLVLLGAMVHGPVTAELGDHHIAYSTSLPAGLLVVSAYVVATCASALFSGYTHIAWYGAVNLVAVAALAYWTISGFASLWCGLAALTSLAIAAHVSFGHRGHPRQRVAQALA